MNAALEVRSAACASVYGVSGSSGTVTLGSGLVKGMAPAPCVRGCWSRTVTDAAAYDSDRCRRRGRYEDHRARHVVREDGTDAGRQVLAQRAVGSLPDDDGVRMLV